MASRYYGIDVGSHTVTEDSSTTSLGMELVVDLTKYTAKKQVLVQLEEIINYITADEWPPTT